MAKNVNRQCLVCQKTYQYCSHGCNKDLDKPAWMASFDTDNCRQICNTFTGNVIGKFISDDQAKAKLGVLDLSNLESFSPKIKDWVLRINATTAIPEQENLELQNTVVEPEILDNEEFEKELNSDEPVG